jgi:hypothetical protein
MAIAERSPQDIQRLRQNVKGFKAIVTAALDAPTLDSQGLRDLVANSRSAHGPTTRPTRKSAPK